MRTFLAALLATAALGARAAEPLVWQLGQPDGSSRDFAVQYHAWEYGRAPAIRRAPEMRHDTHTFHYRVPDAGGVISNPHHRLTAHDKRPCLMAVRKTPPPITA